MIILLISRYLYFCHVLRGAIQDFTISIEINPGFIFAFINRGNVKGSLKDYVGAIEDYSKVIDINPKYAEAYYNRGIDRFNIKDYLGAIEDFTKALEISPDDDEYYMKREMAKTALDQKDSFSFGEFVFSPKRGNNN